MSALKARNYSDFLPSNLPCLLQIRRQDFVKQNNSYFRSKRPKELCIIMSILAGCIIFFQNLLPCVPSLLFIFLTTYFCCIYFFQNFFRLYSKGFLIISPSIKIQLEETWPFLLIQILLSAKILAFVSFTTVLLLHSKLNLDFILNPSFHLPLIKFHSLLMTL